MQKVRAFKEVQEGREAERAEIVGNVPEWVQGYVLRNGPGKWDWPDFTMRHLFDGYMILSKFELNGGENGSVTFSSKFLQSESLRKARAAQRPVISEFATKSAGSDVTKKSVFARFVASMLPENTDNCPFVCNTDLCRNPIAIGDTGFMHELDIKTLTQISRVDPSKEFSLNCSAAHPMTDRETGIVYNVGISLFPNTKWVILKFPEGSNQKTLTETVKGAQTLNTFPCRNKLCIPWFHCFGITKNYIVIIEQPCYFNVSKIVSSIFSKGVSYRDVMEWRPEQKNRLYFVRKDNGKCLQVEVISKEAFFYVHILNCFEENGHIIIDLFSMTDHQFIDVQLIANLRNGVRVPDKFSPRLVRYVIPLCAGDLKNLPEKRNLISGKALTTTATAMKIDGKIVLEPEILSNVFMDYPTTNPNNKAQARFVWATGAFAPSFHQHKITKFDLKTKETITWEAKEHQNVGEPSFIPNPNGVVEDDGVIFLSVTNYFETEETKEGKEKDSAVFLNAKTMEEIGRADFHSEFPYSLHSAFFKK